MVHPTVRIASFDDWKVVEEKAWVVLGGFFGGVTVIYKVTKKSAASRIRGRLRLCAPLGLQSRPM